MTLNKHGWEYGALLGFALMRHCLIQLYAAAENTNSNWHDCSEAAIARCIAVYRKVYGDLGNAFSTCIDYLGLAAAPNALVLLGRVVGSP